MKKYTYTMREVQILQSENPLPITDEEFLAVYHKAFNRNHLHYIIHLGDVYTDIEDRVFSDEFTEKHSDPADRECNYIFPILCPSDRNTAGRIRNMTAYLLGTLDWSVAFKRRLDDLVPYRLVFNYWLEEYVRDYDAVSLWEVYFKRHPELAKMIDRRGISGLDELAYRTTEYFERYISNLCAECRGKRPQGSEKPRRQACLTKQRQRILSGAWGIPNKQSRHTVGVAARIRID